MVQAVQSLSAGLLVISLLPDRVFNRSNDRGTSTNSGHNSPLIKKKQGRNDTIHSTVNTVATYALNKAL